MPLRRVFFLVALVLSTAAALQQPPSGTVAVERRSALAAALAVCVPKSPAMAARTLEVEDVVVGGGDGPPGKGATVSIGYKGWLGGFDSPKQFVDKKGPVYVELGSGQVIPGLDMAIQGTDTIRGMNVGGTRRVAIPPDLAYGDIGFPREGDNKGTLIPPGTTLYFEVRLRSVKLSKGLGFGLNLF